ncbi:MAG TPA: hypothetical protein VGC81_09460 [Candidatus Methylomirabilis sp.]|jgi:hypothetical protein
MSIPDSVERYVIVVLALAAAVQATAVASRAISRPAPASDYTPVMPGDEVSFLVGRNEVGQETRVSLNNTAGRLTAVLAFHSECGWCEKAAPGWADWLASQQEFDVVALTMDPPAVATAYAKGHGWDVRLLSLVDRPSDAVELKIVNYTPWVYVFDARGVMLHQQNGGDLTQLSQRVDAAR